MTAQANQSDDRSAPSDLLKYVRACPAELERQLLVEVRARTIGPLSDAMARDICRLTNGAKTTCPYDCVCGDEVYDELYDYAVGAWRSKSGNEETQRCWTLCILSLISRDAIWRLHEFDSYDGFLQWLASDPFSLTNKNISARHIEVCAWLQWLVDASGYWTTSQLAKELGFICAQPRTS